MIDISKLTYKIVVLGETGGQLDVTDITDNLSWEENDGELAMRLSVTLANTTHNGKRISSIAKPNCYIIVTAEVESASDEVARVRITEWEPTRTGESDSIVLSGYDELYDLQKSQDNRYLPEGTGTDTAIKAIFSEWGIPISRYEGPSNPNAKTTYRNEYLSDIILDLMNTAVQHGEKECVIRAKKGKVSIEPRGTNDTVYVFTDALNLELSRYRISTVDMVTVVKIVAPESSDGRQKIEAIENGKVQYGKRQRILVRDKEDSLATAQAAARKILEDDGKPAETFEVRSPDVPYIRKGDKVKVATRVYEGFAHVLSVQHNATNRAMTMTIEPLTEAGDEKADDQSAGSEPQER